MSGIDISDLFKIFVSAILVKNVVFMRFLALCSFIGMTSDLKKSTGMGWAVLFVTVLATAATYPLYLYVLAPYDLGFLKTLIFILVIASLVQLVEFYLKKSAPALYTAMGVYLPLITTNCAILAVTLDVIAEDYSFLQSMVYSIGCALGYVLAMVVFAGLRERIDVAPVPKYLRGTPILFVTAALISMAFGGFAGII
ncbi:RnfABCDGE type electron transport complex subunit A [Treponema phagedenis]|uniref:Ion-translocating oxidoreductase complex subunit A n=1 Tax=Treponema phagedenis TaxID=162 RepID=A0A0B7GW40_TREPH|nr:RnfABCDGE type electron transport complex subunit A [Treponema phagedenis]EFW37503.1 electron transport complex, RnfABCDGE type, A subunit [Treponema phagedenis F0421]NVP24747.1 RnfABCDGE type electron transport complex subunit A [Treponema phagedenis]QEJ95860.1 RnfABCDGE type electron transport complex subunit A [Treponema phagedenis]QEJ98863.1 RnfABCDGE type electron transport complex subunit A [Treponema phagedenis]QEK00444.1 RnfABCDGE type electron transport complex subunit A [Treponema